MNFYDGFLYLKRGLLHVGKCVNYSRLRGEDRSLWILYLVLEKS